MKQQEPKVGDKVEFYARGQHVRGTVTRIRYKENRKAKRLMEVLRYTHGEDKFNDLPTGRMVAEVAESEHRIWTVSISVLKVVGKGNVQAAQQHVDGVKQSIRERKWKRSEARADAARDNGLWDLKPGDKVLCQFRGGYEQERTFVGIGRSGKVQVKNEFDRVEKHNPQFVRKSDRKA